MACWSGAARAADHGVVAANLPWFPGLEVVAGGHPLVDEGSLRAGRSLLEHAAAAGEDDLVLVLISGGGSALAEVPMPGLGLEDLQAVNRALLRSGASIAEVNTVRRHLSALKGGGLGAAAAPASRQPDHLRRGGEPLEAIAGGPTCPIRPRTRMRSGCWRIAASPCRGGEPHAGRAAAGGADRVVSIIADGSIAAHAAAQAAAASG
jgi:glycerate-2-kinase